MISKRITVMGLGLHGGGTATCRYLASRGALVTATDLRSREVLAPSLEALKDLDITFVLGHHRDEDFTQCDMVIKNPGVPPTSRFLALARDKGIPIESDISLFLRERPRQRVLTVTGSKGKSTTVSALHYGLKESYPGCRLGGNITVSPLSFIDELDPQAPLVLELSSWQLADLRNKGLLRPPIAAITNIYPDHQNRYSSMEEYVSDKQEIYRSQPADGWTLLPGDGPWVETFRGDSPAREIALYTSRPRSWAASSEESTPPAASAWLEKGRGWFFCPRVTGSAAEEILPADVTLKGAHNRMNLLYAGVMMRLFGLSAADIGNRLAAFPGIPHRMEFLGNWQGCPCYNDSAATIPDATAAALNSFSQQAVVLLAGGTDKELVIDPWLENLKTPRRWVLLKGSATDRLLPHLQEAGIPYEGPFDSLETAVNTAREAAQPGDALVLSPGATSFGMFLNEFDRGDQFKELIRQRIE